MDNLKCCFCGKLAETVYDKCAMCGDCLNNYRNLMIIVFSLIIISLIIFAIKEVK